MALACIDVRRGARARAIYAAAIAGTCLLITACGSSGSGQHPGTTIPAKILAGPNHARMVVVPVYIENQGPYLFALDTGAAKSVVDSAIAQQLGLPNQGSVPGGVSGITSTAPATQVRVSHWHVASMALAPDTALAVALTPHQTGTGLDGLLGSDELSKYQVVTVNYSSQDVMFR